MLTLAFYLQEATKDAPTRCGCRIIAGAVAGTAALPLAVLLAACGPPLRKPRGRRAGSVLRAVYALSAAIVAAATHAETQTISGRHHETAGQYLGGSPWLPPTS